MWKDLDEKWTFKPKCDKRIDEQHKFRIAFCFVFFCFSLALFWYVFAFVKALCVTAFFFFLLLLCTFSPSAFHDSIRRPYLERERNRHLLCIDKSGDKEGALFVSVDVLN